MKNTYEDLNGIRHWYKKRIQDNEATPVIILHGGPGGFVKAFEEVPGKQLEDHLNIIYYEQRGCGRSSESINDDYTINAIIEDLKCLIEAWEYKKVHLLGYSFGAELAIEFTLKYPEYVEKLVLQSPSDMSDFERIYRIQTDGFKEILTGESLLKLCKVLDSDKDIYEKYEMAWSLMDRKSSDEFLFLNEERAKWNREQWETCGLFNTGKMASAVIGRVREKTVVESSKEIENETLIISGLHDKNVGIEIPQSYASNIKCSRLVTFTESAHFPDIEETERYVEEVVRFINQK